MHHHHVADRIKFSREIPAKERRIARG